MNKHIGIEKLESRAISYGIYAKSHAAIFFRRLEIRNRTNKQKQTRSKLSIPHTTVWWNNMCISEGLMHGMSPHGITGPPDQSSPNVGNRRMATENCQTLTLHVKFRRSPTKSVLDICPKNVDPPYRREKLDQSSPKSLKTCYGPMPVVVPNFIALCQTT